ncbi:MAG: hypothetical protein CM15mP68_3280 [Pseudomonadota bacterium]|nr:MAG: hypothetical protein CM15mP68_3280 [Pseudomonadota bacterium]
MDKVARAEDPRVKEVNVRIAANHSSMLVMASDGTLSADIRPLVRLDVSVIVEEKVGASGVMRVAVGARICLLWPRVIGRKT